MLLEASSLTFSYGTRKALDNLSFSVPQGATGLLGPNGAGKTTLVRLVMGLLPAPVGKLHLDGKDVARFGRDLRARIGLVPEGDILVPRISAVAYVAYAARIHGLSARIAMDRAHMVLHHVGLGAERYRRVEEFSKGMRQRLKLAQALVHDPPFLMLDEPTDGMDPQGRDEVLELLHDLATVHGKSLLLCTHILDDVQRVCRSVLVISKGKTRGLADIGGALGEGNIYSLAITGRPEQFNDIMSSHGVRGSVDADGEGQVTLSEDDVDRLVALAWEGGIHIRKIVPIRESLGQLFTRLLREEHD